MQIATIETRAQHQAGGLETKKKKIEIVCSLEALSSLKENNVIDSSKIIIREGKTEHSLQSI